MFTKCTFYLYVIQFYQLRDIESFLCIYNQKNIKALSVKTGNWAFQKQKDAQKVVQLS